MGGVRGLGLSAGGVRIHAFLLDIVDLVEQLAGEALWLPELRCGRPGEGGDDAPTGVCLLPCGVELTVLGVGHPQVAVDDRVVAENDGGDRVRHGELRPVPHALRVVQPENVALGEGLVAAGYLVRTLPRQRHLGQRGAKLTVLGEAALSHRHSIDQPGVVVPDTQRLVEVQGIDRVLRAQLLHPSDEQLAPCLAGGVDVTELDVRLTLERPDPPQRLMAERVPNLVRLELRP